MATFSNNATLSYNGNTTISNTVTGTLQEILSASKHAVVNSYSAGSKITYVVALVNSGTTPLVNLTVNDDLGGYSHGNTVYPLTYTPHSIKYHLNGVLQANPTLVQVSPLIISGINIPPGGNATLVYETKANEFAPLDTASTIKNTVTVTGEGVASPVTATENILTNDVPELAISKSLSPIIVTDNGQLTYTFTIQNRGNTAADGATGVTLTDDFNPILNPITVSFNGASWAETTDYTYNVETGAFATVLGKITVPAATFNQDSETGKWSVEPGVSTLVVTGTV